MGKHALRPYAMCCVFVFMADSPNALHALHALVCSNSEESRETTQSPVHLGPSIRPAGAAYGAHGNQRHFSQTIDVASEARICERHPLLTRVSFSRRQWILASKT